MKIKVAKTAGFCFGVERAVRLAFDITSDKPTYTFGPIIHNDAVVNKLKVEKGIMPTDKLERGHMDTLIIRSHGVAPDIYKDAETKGIRVVDATCPYVKKIHKLVDKYYQRGYKIILVGNKDHPEIIGINGWAENSCVILKNVEELKQLELTKDEKYFIVSQTTYKKGIVDEIIDYLKQLEYTFEYVNTICNATKERQDEAVELAKEVNCMLVIGSAYSSNTQKLFEICKQACEKTYCIEDASKIDVRWFEGCTCIGITAGASTPSYSIEEVIKTLENEDIN